MSKVQCGTEKSWFWEVKVILQIGSAHVLCAFNNTSSGSTWSSEYCLALSYYEKVECAVPLTSPFCRL